MAYSVITVPSSWEAYRSDANLVRDALSKVTSDLIARLPDGGLVPAMEANGVLTAIESRQISGERNPVERNKTLLRCLQQKDAHTILQFFAVLKIHRDLGGYNELVDSFTDILRDLKLAAVVGTDYCPSVGQLPLLRLVDRKLQFLQLPSAILEEYNILLKELSAALFTLSPAKLKQVAQWIEQLVIHPENCKGMTRLSSRLPPSCLSAKYLFCFICHCTSPLDVSIVSEVCEVLQHRKLEKIVRNFVKHQPVVELKSLAAFPIEVTPINSSGEFCHITVDIPSNPEEIQLLLVREIRDYFMSCMKTSIMLFQGYQRTELSSVSVCTLFYLIPSRIASNLLKEVDSVLAKLPVRGILRIGIMDTSQHTELGFAQDKKIAHCSLGTWKGESVESWDPLQGGRERILILNALLAEKKEMLEIRRKEMLMLGAGHGYSNFQDEGNRSDLIRGECIKLDRLCQFLQEQLDEAMYQESAPRGTSNGGPVSPNHFGQEVWYRNDISIESESEILLSCPVGAFIVRDSQSFHGFHTLLVRKENSVCKFALRRAKGICSISDVLQFASINDLVRFFTRHSFDIGVKLRPMNVTEYHQMQQQQNGSVPTVPPMVSDAQPETYEEALETIAALRRQLERSNPQVFTYPFTEECMAD